MSNETNKCTEVMEHMASIIDGDEATLAKYADHLAECDACRDARHDATLAAELLPHAGADYEPPADLEQRVLAAIDERDESSGELRPTVATADSQSETQSPDEGAETEPPAPTEISSTTSSEDRKGSSSTAPKKANYWIFAAAAAVLVAVGGIGYYISLSDEGRSEVVEQIANNTQSDQPGATGLPSATITQIVRAASDDATGVTLRNAGSDSFEQVTVDAEVTAGSTIRTDERTRIRLSLTDGTTLVLNHNTELRFDEQAARSFHLAPGGEVLADVAHLEQGPRAEFHTPTGRVEVLGTKLLVTTTEEASTVRVTRGVVRVHGADGSQAEVKAGEEAVLPQQGAPTVAQAVNLAGSVSWSEIDDDEVEASASGMGELRAKRPGEREESERPLTLTRHNVKVRIVGNVARTEVEEVFRNDSGVTLEGIYRFPLPPDARIARLALDVDGELEEGAFVERDQAAKIWRGVIRRATPQSQRLQQQEFIWVPGPWRDPALLEWQQGGQFQLRIFPIKAHSERRVILAYEQTVEPHGEGRRYVYPLAHSNDGSTRAGLFNMDIRIAGADPASPVKAHNYRLQNTAEGAATRLRMNQANFIPAGDVVIDYQLAGNDQELRWWTYQGPAAAAPSVEGRRGGRRGSTTEVVDAQRALANDQRPYVVFALRPELPMRTQSRPRDYVIVVDSSQSMVGEQYNRVAELATGLVAEMDRRDRFTVMACDATCEYKPGGPRTPSAEAATETQQWLTNRRPAGGSDLLGALNEAANAARQSSSERDVRIIYIGDGVASIGHRTAAAVSSHVQTLAQSDNITFTTVGLGGDADTLVLSAIARAGGGHYLRHVPGQRTSAIALRVLETTYGVSLRNARLELPQGVTDVVPAQLPTLRAGEEVVVAARFANEVQGEIVLRGEVGGEEYVDRYPVTLTPSTAAGNAFVPRLWAAATINELELRGTASDHDRIVALSRGYSVMSRHTSLLVLESEAMFRAFRIDRARPSIDWTGEDEQDSNEASGTEDHDGVTTIDSVASRGMLGAASAGGGGGGVARRRARRARSGSRAPAAAMARSEAEQAPAMMDSDDSSSAWNRNSGPMARPAPVTSTPLGGRSRGQWMRRVWQRVGSINANANELPRHRQAVTEAENRLRAEPNSRDRHRDLYRALARVGDLERAQDIAEQWVSRDQLDPEALIALSDVLARRGERNDALRLLTGVVDLETDNRDLHERLAEAFDRAGDATRACSHRVALAESDGATADQIADAIRCERSLGQATLAGHLLSAINEQRTRRRVERALGRTPRDRGIRGDLMLEALWSGMQDIDISLINNRGERISWMGGRSNVVGESARTNGRERLGLRWTPRGTYYIEVSRTDPSDTTPITGTITVRALRARQTLNFTLLGPNARIGSVRVNRESRLVPAGF